MRATESRRGIACGLQKSLDRQTNKLRRDNIAEGLCIVMALERSSDSLNRTSPTRSLTPPGVGLSTSMQTCQSLVFGTWYNDIFQNISRVCAAVNWTTPGNSNALLTSDWPPGANVINGGSACGKNALTHTRTVCGIAIPGIQCREHLQAPGGTLNTLNSCRSAATMARVSSIVVCQSRIPLRINTGAPSEPIRSIECNRAILVPRRGGTARATAAPPPGVRDRDTGASDPRDRPPDIRVNRL